MADSKLLKILAKIASQLTDLKDVITITEPCAPRRSPAHQWLPPFFACATLCCCNPVPERLPTVLTRTRTRTRTLTSTLT